MQSFYRLRYRTQGFRKGNSGASLNYYYKDTDGDLHPNVLYQVWNLDFNDRMFAWVYKKSDLWVIGTGSDHNVKDHQHRFVDYIKDRYNFKGDNLVKKEGFSSTMDYDNPDRVWLGNERVLMAGDSAGLIDLYRGVGMDIAALSGRLAAKAICKGLTNPKIDVYETYAQMMKKHVKQTQRNQYREINQFTKNADLQKHLDKTFKKQGLIMLFQGWLNRLRSPERITLLPP